MIHGNLPRYYKTANYSKHYYYSRYKHKPTRVYMCCRYWGTSNTDMFKLGLLMHKTGRYDKVTIKKANFGYCIYATKELANIDEVSY